MATARRCTLMIFWVKFRLWSLLHLANSIQVYLANTNYIQNNTFQRFAQSECALLLLDDFNFIHM